MRCKRRKQIEKAKRMVSNKHAKQWRKQIIEERGKFVQPICSGCGEEMSLHDEYAKEHGFCSISCGMITYGLTQGDFY